MLTRTDFDGRKLQLNHGIPDYTRAPPAYALPRAGRREWRCHSSSLTLPMTYVRTTLQPPSTPPNPTHPPTYTHRVMLWTYVVGQTTWLWIITTTTAATEPNAMVNWMSLHKARG